MTMVPYPPSPEFSGSTTFSTAATATAASKAFPPARRIATPASLASGCAVLTIPAVASTGGAGGALKARATHIAASTTIAV
jgi:hypothetical protein